MTEARELSLLCPRCGEGNPAGFPVCWSCHAELPASERAERAPAAPAPLPEAAPSAPRRKRLVLEVAIVLGALWVPSVIGGILHRLEPSPPMSALEAGLGSLAGVGSLALLAYLAWLDGGDWRRSLGIRRPHPADLVWGVCTFVVLVLSSACVGALAAYFRHDPPEYPPLLTPDAWWIGPLYFLFWALYEEVLFRAYLWNRVRELTGRPWHALVAVSVVFSAVHAYPLDGSIAVFLHGMILGTAFFVRRSLWPLVLGHWAFNVFVAG